MDSFKNSAVIVTGASSGIGKALARRLAGEGALLALAARDSGRLQAFASECENRGGTAIAVPTDVADEAQSKSLVEQTVARYGHIDMLVNNAGIGVVGGFEDLPDLRLFKQVMDVNFQGFVNCTYHALPYLRETRGRIVNVSSLAGKIALPFNTSYVASKFAVMGFSDSLRMELARSGVSVTTICPSWVVTEFHERLMDEEGIPKGPEGRRIYTKRTMTADRCAEIIMEAAGRRKREAIIWPGPVALWLKLLAPGLLDKIIVRTLMRAAIKGPERSGSD